MRRETVRFVKRVRVLRVERKWERDRGGLVFGDEEGGKKIRGLPLMDREEEP